MKRYKLWSTNHHTKLAYAPPAATLGRHSLWISRIIGSGQNGSHKSPLSCSLRHKSLWSGSPNALLAINGMHTHQPQARAGGVAASEACRSHDKIQQESDLHGMTSSTISPFCKTSKKLVKKKDAAPDASA